MPSQRSASQPSSRLPGPRRGGVRRALTVPLLVLALAVPVALHLLRPDERVTPTRVLGAPVRAATANGDALFVLTHRWQRRVQRNRWNLVGRSWNELQVDLWRLDAATARPVWTRRLLTEKEGAATDLALLGADDGTLWLFVRGPRAVSADDGALLADAEGLAGRNPSLRGRLPGDPRWYALATDGLRVTTTDAATFRLDPRTLAAHPAARATGGDAANGDVATDGATANGDMVDGDTARRPVARPPFFTPNATHLFQERGLHWPGRWLGLFADEEAEAFRRPVEVPGARPGDRPGAAAAHLTAMRAPPALDGLAPLRYRLWSARVRQRSAAPAGWPDDMPGSWGTRDEYTDLAPLPESPEFLQGGLLSADGRATTPLVLREPDGVLVLHRDRLGEEGRLRLTRIAGPGGRPLWEAALPLSVLQSVLPGPRTLVLFGIATPPPAPAPTAPRPRNATADAHDVVVSVDLATGEVRSVDLTEEGRGGKD